MNGLVEQIVEISRNAKEASRSLVAISAEKKNQVLLHVAELLRERADFIQSENKKDLEAGREKGLSAAMLESKPGRTTCVPSGIRLPVSRP